MPERTASKGKAEDVAKKLEEKIMDVKTLPKGEKMFQAAAKAT
jgi:hypothetical protein